jgi:hypothetical protein
MNSHGVAKVNLNDERGPFAGAHDAFNRMKRAHDRKTGCHLTAQMIEALSITFLGEVWSSPDPRALRTKEPSRG